MRFTTLKVMTYQEYLEHIETQEKSFFDYTIITDCIAPQSLPYGQPEAARNWSMAKYSYPTIIAIREGVPIEEAELEFYRYIPGQYLRYPPSVLQPLKEALNSYWSADLDWQNLKTEIRNTLNRLTTRRDYYHRLKAQLSDIYLLTKGTGYVTYTVKDVTAQDTEGNGEDIYLGNLTYKIDLIQKTITLESGSECRSTQYTSGAYHPHQLGGGALCFGSREADIIEALWDNDLSIVKAYLHNFSHQYTSSDTAGANWVLWADGNYIEIDGTYYREDEVVWDEYDEQNILLDDAIYIDELGGYTLVDNTVYSKHYHRHILTSKAVHVENYGYILEDDEDFVYLDDHRSWFHISDVVEPYSHPGEQVLKTDCVYSTYLDSWILEDEAVEYKGDWYTEDTVPEEEQENEESTDKIVAEDSVTGEPNTDSGNCP